MSGHSRWSGIKHKKAVVDNLQNPAQNDVICSYSKNKSRIQSEFLKTTL